MKLFATLLIVLFSASAFAQQDQIINGKWAYYGQEFYAKLANKQNVERELLSQILNGAHSSTNGKLDTYGKNCERGATCYRHVSVGYDRARKIMFGELDKLTDSKGTYVLDVYCGQKFYFRNVDEVSNMHDRVNIEHTWPQSKFNSSIAKDIQKSDMHHLYLTDSMANSRRGNNPFGFVSNEEDRSGGEGCRNSRYGFIDGGDVYTPPAAHRGNVARSLFYFSMRYGLEIRPSEESILRQWHKADPVDANEIRRHEGVAKYEKTRNPFVDHPELVDLIKNF